MNKLSIILGIKGNSSNRLRESYIKKHHRSIYDDIMDYTKNLDIKFIQRIWHWVNDVSNYVTCCCGNRVSFNMNWEDGYKEFCSNKCASNSEKVKNKLKDTCLKNFGVEHYSKTDEYKEKVNKTSIEKYGVDNYSKTNEYKEKSKKTYIEKYGIDNYTKTEEYKLKSKNTQLNKYGVDHYSKTKEFKDRFKEKMADLYSNVSIFENDEYRKLNFKIANNPNYIKYLGNSINLFKCDCDEYHLFKISTDNYYGRTHANNKLCTICNTIDSLTSLKENMFYDFIFENYKGEIVKNYRDVLEIDVYLPELNIGFEFNGLYYHSDKFKNKDYHYDKTLYFKDKGIRLIHIWEDDWIYKNKIVKSQILYLLKKTENKIYARDCIIKEITDSKICSNFLDENHLQGKVNSIYKIGLFYQDELVSLMTFDKFEGRKKMKESDWNLNRFCNKLNTTVIGSASRLLTYFIKHNNPNRIISYADRNWSIGNLYFKLGFKMINISKPDYKYLVRDRRIHKSNFKKSITKTLLTESEYAKNNNLYKIWDCGKIKFEK